MIGCLMNKLRMAGLLLGCSVLLSLSVFAQNARQPNIVLVLADDLGWKDVGYQGSDFYETPNIDRLAKAGMVFTQAYAGAGNCAPSRAVLLSGQYGPRHGVYAVDSTDRGPKNLMRMIPIPNKSGLAPAQVTMAEALKAAGYATGIFGKWHLGGPDGATPEAQGFDVYFDSRKPNPNQRRDEPEDPKGIYSLTRTAVSFIEQNKDKPFFAYVAQHAIHSALEARPASLAKFKAKQPGAQHKNALYAACLYDLDDGVGLLLNILRTVFSLLIHKIIQLLSDIPDILYGFLHIRKFIPDGYQKIKLRFIILLRYIIHRVGFYYKASFRRILF